MPDFSYSNTATTTISDAGGISAGDLSMGVASVTGFPSTGQFTVLIDSELILVTASASPWTIARAQEGTTAATHADGATITHVLSRDSLEGLLVVQENGVSLGNGRRIDLDGSLFELTYDAGNKLFRAKLGDPSMWSVVDDFVVTSGVSGAVGELSWLFTNGSTSGLPGETDRPGIIRRDTSTTINTVAWIGLRSISGMVAASFFDCTFWIRPVTVDANTILRFGVVDNANVQQWASGVYIEKAAADTQWFGVARNAGTQSRTAQLGTVTGAVWYKLRVRRVNSTTVGFTVDAGAEVTLNTNLPTATMAFAMEISNTAAASKTLDIDRFTARITGISRT